MAREGGEEEEERQYSSHAGTVQIGQKPGVLCKFSHRKALPGGSTSNMTTFTEMLTLGPLTYKSFLIPQKKKTFLLLGFATTSLNSLGLGCIPLG